jgi:STAM-binding protein
MYFCSLIEAGPSSSSASLNGDSQEVSTLNSVLSLDDGRWQRHSEAVNSQFISDATEDPFQFVGMKQPSPPPVLAQVHQELAQICPSKVADPRPGPAIPSLEGKEGSNSYQHLHVVCSSCIFFHFCAVSTNSIVFVRVKWKGYAYQVENYP